MKPVVPFSQVDHVGLADAAVDRAQRVRRLPPGVVLADHRLAALAVDRPVADRARGCAPFTLMNSKQALESLTPSAPQLPVFWNRSVLRDMNSVTPSSIQSVLPHGCRAQVAGPAVASAVDRQARRQERVVVAVGHQLDHLAAVERASGSGRCRGRSSSSVFVFSSGSSSTWPSGGVTRLALRMQPRADRGGHRARRPRRARAAAGRRPRPPRRSAGPPARRRSAAGLVAAHVL